MHHVFCRNCGDDLGPCPSVCDKTQDHDSRGLCTWCLQHERDVKDYLAGNGPDLF